MDAERRPEHEQEFGIVYMPDQAPAVRMDDSPPPAPPPPPPSPPPHEPPKPEGEG